MKRILFTLTIIFSFSVLMTAQVIVFSDDFESYIVGQQLACQNPVDWTTWTNSPCSPVEDAYISSNFAYSGTKSTVIVLNNDLVKPLGNVTTGQWRTSFMVYIPSGSNGYFNTLCQFSPPTYLWGVEVYFNAGGLASVNAGGTGTASFPFSYDTWFPVDVYVYLTGTPSDWAELWVNNTLIYGWQWSSGASGGGSGALMLGGTDLFGATAQDQMYVDDYTVWDLIIPVELTSFTAIVNSNSNVVLNWSTATETNNHMFEVERKAADAEYFTIGFVEGAGTTTEPQNYNYVDKTVETGKYFYRLKQLDFDGRYEYSDEVEVDVIGPLTFNLEQNYPNPFNPSTKIKYSVPEAGNIRLSVYNTVGEEVGILINGYSESGFFEVTFDASNLTSGVYLYKLQSENSVQFKKMMLLK